VPPHRSRGVDHALALAIVALDPGRAASAQRRRRKTARPLAPGRRPRGRAAKRVSAHRWNERTFASGACRAGPLRDAAHASRAGCDDGTSTRAERGVRHGCAWLPGRRRRVARAASDPARDARGRDRPRPRRPVHGRRRGVARHPPFPPGAPRAALWRARSDARRRSARVADQQVGELLGLRRLSRCIGRLDHEEGGRGVVRLAQGGERRAAAPGPPPPGRSEALVSIAAKLVARTSRHRSGS
jgi:hypothetical protein